MKTEYRIVNDGYWDFLQYKHHHKFLFFKWISWQYIPRPYFDKIYGRDYDITHVKTEICSYNTKLQDFIKKYPDIEEYFKYFREEQRRLQRKGMREYWEILDRMAKENK